MNFLFNEEADLEEAANCFTVTLVESVVPIAISDDESQVACIFIFFIYLARG